MNPLLVQLFRDALDLEPSERKAYLDAQCSDAVLRMQVDALLLAAEQTQTPLLGMALPDLSVQKRESVDRSGELVGAFRLQKPLGQGGMGAVWLAERVAGFSQQVAIKWLHAGLSSSARARFARERETLAKLAHPGIARIVDGGREGDADWFAMEYVDGLTLDLYVAQANASLSQRIKLIIALCDAVQYAHQNLIVHRDLKPANILVSPDGQPKLLDFGVAKFLDDADHTVSRAPMTFAYAAPEQIRGDAISTATDVYGLGVILYELLTGERPHKAKAAESGGLSLLQAITDTDATAPSLVINRSTQTQGCVKSSQLRGDLDIILLKALNRDPARRYSSAQALADDLTRYLDGLPISARKDSFRYHLVKLMRRNKLPTAAVTVAVASLILATIVSTIQTQRANDKAAHTLVQNQRYVSMVAHLAAVLNRARTAGPNVSTELLFDWVADPTLEDAAANTSLKIGISGILRSTSDSHRMLKVLDSIGPEITLVSKRDQGVMHSDRALALMRLGRFDEAKIALEAYATLKLAPSTDDAWVQDFLSSVHTRLGNTEASISATLESVRIVRSLPDVGPKVVGQILTNASVSMLGAAKLTDANRFAQEALAIYRQNEMSLKSELTFLNSLIAKIDYTRGNLLTAQAQFAQIERNDPGEPPLTKVLRHAVQARGLALLAQPQQAIDLVQSARKEICAIDSKSSFYCARLTLAVVDVALMSGDYALAGHALESLDASSLSGVLINLSAQSRLRLQLMTTPSIASVQAYENWVLSNTESGLPRLSTRRALLVSAQQLWMKNQPELAMRLAQAALELTENLPKDSFGLNVLPRQDSGVDGGMDESLLTIWQARINGEATTQAMRAQLARAIGETHPWVER